MKPFCAILLLCPWLALSAWSQTTTILAPPQPLSQVQQFLGLTDDQVTAILQNNSDYNTFSSQQQQTIQNAQSQIAVETAKDPLDPMALGTLYAGIETTCRALRDKAATSQTQNISILTDVQKAKLNVLSDAMKLIPTISQAQSGNLLGSAGSPPYFFNTASSFSLNGVFVLGTVSGCGSPFPSGTYGSFLSSIALFVGPTGTANRTVNHWFDRTDFYRGGFENLIKPQTKTQ